MQNSSSFTQKLKEVSNVYLPQILRLNEPSDKQFFKTLIDGGKVTYLHDEICSQLRELIKGKNPSKKLKDDDYTELINQHLKDEDINDYGVWVYYPWNQRLVHLLDEEEYVEVRTNRNQYKITKKERDILSQKKIGIIGLSVGQSIALTLAMERGFGELRLADFDILELSNLNRIRTPVYNIGIPKVVIAAREIAEIDPFLKVKCFFDGLTESNMDAFFTENGKLDLLVDECDGLDIKIISRFKARELKIPVIMDTSDRGMLDVERFDLEPERPVLHGTVEDVDPHTIKNLSNEDKIPIILKMLGAENVSLRGKASMVEVEQTINTWPQLASSVTLGGAVGADVCRRILLDQFHESGRYYIDLEEIIGNEKKDYKPAVRNNPFSPLLRDEMISAIGANENQTDDIIPNIETINTLVSAACAAPSTGNDQPWKWYYKSGTLYLFHDEYRSYSFGDFQKIASFITFGAAFENLYIKALDLGLNPYYQFIPNKTNEKLVLSIRFKKSDSNNQFLLSLNQEIFNRHTNRNLSPKVELSSDILSQLSQYGESIPQVKVQWFTNENDIKELGEIIGACDRMRILNPEGHYDFVHHEMRWSKEEAEMKKDGIDMRTLGLTKSQLAALGIIKDDKVVAELRNLDGGYALDMLAKRNVETASALCLISLPKYELRSFFEGGRAMERLWLAATGLKLSIHPLISPLYFFPRILHGKGEGLSSKNIEELKGLRTKFQKITGVLNDEAEVFLAKISVSEKPTIKTLRLPVEEVLIIER